MTVKPPTILWATMIALLFLFLIASESFAWLGGEIIGSMMARYDLLRGHYEIRICDLRDCTGSLYTDDPEEREYRRLLQSKHGITYNVICGSAHYPEGAFSQSWYRGNAVGYNAVALPAVYQKFGKVLLVRVHREAILNYMSSSVMTDKQREILETALRVDEMQIEELMKEER